jgi:hypothetical protein
VEPYTIQSGLPRRGAVSSELDLAAKARLRTYGMPTYHVPLKKPHRIWRLLSVGADKYHAVSVASIGCAMTCDAILIQDQDHRGARLHHYKKGLCPCSVPTIYHTPFSPLCPLHTCTHTGFLIYLTSLSITSSISRYGGHP